MKTRFLIVIICIHVSCSSEEPAIDAFYDDHSIQTLNGTWKVVSFEDFDTKKTEVKTFENSWDEDIVITFDDTKQPGLLAGKNISNMIQARFSYVGDRQLRVTDLVSTYANQPEWSDKFTEAILDNSATFRINVAQLRVYYRNQSKSMTLTKQ